MTTNTFGVDRRSFLMSMFMTAGALMLPGSTSAAIIPRIRLVRRIRTWSAHSLSMDFSISQWRPIGGEWQEWKFITPPKKNDPLAVEADFVGMPSEIEMGYYTFDLERFLSTLRSFKKYRFPCIYHLTFVDDFEVLTKMTEARARSLFDSHVKEILITVDEAFCPPRGYIG